MTFEKEHQNTVLDYEVNVTILDEADRIVPYAGTNYSVTGELRQFTNTNTNTMILP
jgi:hypothetical protein